MAWYMTELRWLERAPSKRQLYRINRHVRWIDDQAPELDDDGISSSWKIYGLRASWRNPKISLRVLINMLHCLGFPCRGRWIKESFDRDLRETDALMDSQRWSFSHPNLSKIRRNRNLIYILRRLSRALHPYLPGRASEEEPPRQRP